MTLYNNNNNNNEIDHVIRNNNDDDNNNSESDNDDDGNKGVRINAVFEHGNYGYVDEMTGEGWSVNRTNIEKEIPLRHWHLNDPGVVPNLLQTGAGSPTGMIIYEGNLLPSIFQNQMIHTDAGPNVVRSYATTPWGAGYEARINNLITSRDQWFRPADLAAAPDGSLYIADWYDPGVGGHQAGDRDPRAGGRLDDAPFHRRVRRPLVAVLPRCVALGRRDPSAHGQGHRAASRRGRTDPHDRSLWRLSLPGRWRRSCPGRCCGSPAARCRSPSRLRRAVASRRSSTMACRS